MLQRGVLQALNAVGSRIRCTAERRRSGHFAAGLVVLQRHPRSPQRVACCGSDERNGVRCRPGLRGILRMGWFLFTSQQLTSEFMGDGASPEGAWQRSRAVVV